MAKILKSYDPHAITVGALGGHSALDVCAGAKRWGLSTLVVAQKGREKTYTRYFKRRKGAFGRPQGCVDHVIVVKNFKDIVKPEIQKKLRALNTVFIHSRYFWVYCNFSDIEKKFKVPIFGTRNMLKLEERDQPKNQYFILQKAGIRIPRLYKTPAEIDRLVLVKVNEATRGYERAFFTASNEAEFWAKGEKYIAEKRIKRNDLLRATIEEFVIGAHVNFNFFYSPLEKRLELLGTDTRRQTNLDGLLRLPAWEQNELRDVFHVKLIETGHMAVTVKESLLEKIFDAGERFVKTTQRFSSPGIIGPFALQGAIVAEEGREEIVIFDVSMRIPGSPGTRATPYSGYLYGDSISVGERIAREIRLGIEMKKLPLILT